MAKKYRLKSVFSASRFDPKNPPRDVTPRVFGRDKGVVVWFWVAPDGAFDPNLTVREGQWMLVDQYGTRSVVDDVVFPAIYEEIPNAGEGGG